MSCYGWESGDIVIPAGQWASVKKSIRDRVNKSLDRDYESAVRYYEKTLAVGKGKRKFDHGDALVNILMNDRSLPESYGMEKMLNVLYPHGVNEAKPKRPLKKDFPYYTNKDKVFEDIGCRVSFDDKYRTLTWSVPENNHAVETAHETPLGKAVFDTLKKVRWTRGSGGTIIGNDEYNKDDMSADETAANYVSARFGPR
jgi:hypothetical protein